MTELPATSPLSTAAPGRARAGAASAWLYGLRNFAIRRPLGFVGGVIVVVLILLAIFAPWVAPYNPDAQDLRARLEGPSSAHWLGTDQVGHDVLSRLIYGARLSMTVGFGAVILSSIVATVLGLASAYIGGLVDAIVQRFVDAWIAMPDLVILITILGVVRRMENANMVLAMLFALAILRVGISARIVRSVVLEVRARPFIECAYAAGATPIRIMSRHVFPNIFPLIFITATIALPNTILAEASLSFLGFGPAGEPSWGQMLAVDGREFFRKAPGLAIFPGVAIGLAVFGFNLFGDALRDALDPRLRGGR